MTSDLVLITALCREAVKLGLNVGMSDARPAAVFRVPTRPPTWMTAEVSGNFYEWRGEGSRHPVTDPAGAARLISECLTP